MQEENEPRLAYITAGAAGMYCGSCMRDNTLVAALRKLGFDAVLIPTYTPITTDEADVSQSRVFFGGINVYLQEKSWLFRNTPWFLDRIWDIPRLLRWVSRFASRTKYEDLGEMTLSMLRGREGRQRKEIKKLVHFLSTDLKPHLINLTNALLSGMVAEMKKQLNVPILCTLQGDDVFIEVLPAPYRDRALALIRKNCALIDGFITTSSYYADFMSEYFQIPREKMHVVYPGLNLEGHGGERPSANGRPPTIGYFARICREKGAHNLFEAYRILRRKLGVSEARLRISGWLGENDREFFAKLREDLETEGLGHELEHVESPDHESKVRFLHSIDVLSVPTTYREPKGLYVLEALANGVPVVQPSHGSFPELIEATGGGILVRPEDPEHLAEGLLQLLSNPTLREQMGKQGQQAVLERFHAARMAQETAQVYDQYLKQNPSS